MVSISFHQNSNFLQITVTPSTDQFHHLFSTSFRAAKMAYRNNHSFNNTNSSNNNINSFNTNTNSFNTNTNTINNVSNYIAADERPQILAWLSPLEPRIRHKDIQERRVENIGGWVLETEAFKSWYASDGGSGSDNAVLFCYGDPGAGKTFIKY